MRHEIHTIITIELRNAPIDQNTVAFVIPGNAQVAEDLIARLSKLPEFRKTIWRVDASATSFHRIEFLIGASEKLIINDLKRIEWEIKHGLTTLPAFDVKGRATRVTIPEN